MGAATDLMLANGVAATSLDEVLDRSRASKGQLYHYFRNKEALVSAVAEHACALVMANQHRLAEVEDWESLRGWFRQIVDSRNSRRTNLGCPVGTLAGELAATDEQARRVLADAFADWQRRLREALAELQHQGSLDARADIGALATATLASLQGGLLLAKATRSTEPLRIALDAAYAHLRTYATDPTSTP